MQNGGRHSRSGWTPARTLLAGLAALVLTFFALGALFQGHIAGLEVCRALAALQSFKQLSHCVIGAEADVMERAGLLLRWFQTNIMTRTGRVFEDTDTARRACVWHKASAR